MSQTFQNQRGDLRITYPEGWFVKEWLYNTPYQVVLSREQVQGDGDRIQVGITCFKVYHQSWYPEVSHPIGELMDHYVDSLRNDGRLKWTGSRDPIAVGGVEGLKQGLSFVGSTGPDITLYLVYAKRGDAVVWLLLEAPSAEFERYRQTFDGILRTIVVFSSEGEDNALIDRDTNRLLIQAMERYQGRDLSGANQIFSQAQAISPMYAKTHLMMGSYLMYVAMGSPEASQPKIIEGSKQQLRQAIELYDKYADDYREKERKFDLSQCYFLLGDIEYRFRGGNLEEAKRLYQKSLEYFEHPEAKRTLERFDSPTGFVQR